MSIDLVLVPSSNCCIFLIHLIFLILAIVAWTTGDAYCDETYAQNADGSFPSASGNGCDSDKRCQILQAYNQHTDGRVFETGGISFSCGSSEDCECSGLSLSDPAFTTLVVCGLFFFVKLLIEAYLIYCANYLINNNFKNDSKKILRLSESVWLRCVQCRAIAAWQTVMQSYEDGHFYAFQERVFYATTFVNFVFLIISIVGYVDLNESEPGIAIFFIVGSVITVLLMCFSCFAKYQYIQWAQSDEDDTEMATR